MTKQRRIDGLLHLLAGGLIFTACLWWGFVRKHPFFPVPVRVGGLLFGLGLAALGFWSSEGTLIRMSRNFCLSFLSLCLLVALLQVFFRVIGFDFNREEALWRRFPPFERQPIVPSGLVFFRRPGPERWSGQVMNTILRQLHISPNPYRDDPKITVNYDSLGFRNEEGLTNWEIAVAGDSFTELGYLPYEQLYTTILGRTLHVRVANFGASYTGPLTYLSYLRDYGVAPGTRDTIIMFFEGNDLRDLEEEYAALTEFQKTGRRPYRNFNRQTSMLRALYRMVRSDGVKDLAPREPVVTAYFKSGHGDVPITLNYTPPNRDQIPPEGMSRLEYFFSQYEAFRKERGVETWLAYMPCKDRVVHGMIELATNAPERFRHWEPTDLPQVIRELAERHKVRFIDLTPCLVDETKKSKELLFNSIYDTHLTARGSLVVAGELARQLAPALSPPRN